MSLSVYVVTDHSSDAVVSIHISEHAAVSDALSRKRALRYRVWRAMVPGERCEWVEVTW